METASNSRYAQSDFQKCSGVVQYGSKWELLGIEPTDTLTMVRAKHIMSGQEVELLRGWATLLGKMSSGIVLPALGAGLLSPELEFQISSDSWLHVATLSVCCMGPALGGYRLFWRAFVNVGEGCMGGESSDGSLQVRSVWGHLKQCRRLLRAEHEEGRVGRKVPTDAGQSPLSLLKVSSVVRGLSRDPSF